MYELSLFAGSGGSTLAGHILGWRCVGAVEVEPYCQAVLKARIADGCLEPFPIFGDIRAFIAEGYADAYGRSGVVDVVSGGFPCQDISTAGKGAGIDGSRSGLWREMASVVAAVRPRFVLVENVRALVSRGLDRVLGDLSDLGYDAVWDCFRASDVGAPHRRERVFILAQRRDVDHSDTERLERIAPRPDRRGEPESGCAPLAHASDDGHEPGTGLGADRERLLPPEPASGRGHVGGPGEPERHGGDVADSERAERRTNLHARIDDQDRQGTGWQQEDGPPVGEGRNVAHPRSEPPQLRRGPGVLGSAPADAAGEGHQRERGRAPAGPGGTAVADSQQPRLERRPLEHARDKREAAERGGSPDWAFPPGPSDAAGWTAYLAAGGPEPAIRRGTDGPSDRLDGARANRAAQLRALGNAWVPHCAALAFVVLRDRLEQMTPTTPGPEVG